MYMYRYMPFLRNDVCVCVFAHLARCMLVRVLQLLRLDRMVSKQKVTGVALDDAVSRRLLSDHVCAEAMVDPSQLFPYGQVGEEAKLWKRGPKWSDLWRNKSFLEDAAVVLKGRTLLSAGWLTALQSFFESHPKNKLSNKDIVRASYRSRAMLAHLRDCKRERKSPPERFARLQGIIDMMLVKEPDIDEGQLNITENKPNITEGKSNITGSQPKITDGKPNIEGKPNITEGKPNITEGKPNIEVSKGKKPNISDDKYEFEHKESCEDNEESREYTDEVKGGPTKLAQEGTVVDIPSNSDDEYEFDLVNFAESENIMGAKPSPTKEQAHHLRGQAEHVRLRAEHHSGPPEHRGPLEDCRGQAEHHGQAEHRHGKPSNKLNIDKDKLNIEGQPDNEGKHNKGQQSGILCDSFSFQDLFKGAEKVKPIDPRTGNKSVGWGEFVPMKRPAASGEMMGTPNKRIATSSEPTPSAKPIRKSSKSKLVYSTAYHLALKEHKKVLPEGEAKEKAREAARAAIAISKGVHGFEEL